MGSSTKKRTLMDFISYKEVDILKAEYKVFNEDLRKAIRKNDYKTIGDLIVNMVTKYYFGKKVVSHVINHILVDTPNDGSYEYQKLMNLLGTQFCTICYNNYTTIPTLYGWLKDINVKNAEEYDTYSNLMYEHLVKGVDVSYNNPSDAVFMVLYNSLMEFISLGVNIGNNLTKIEETYWKNAEVFMPILRFNGLTNVIMDKLPEDALCIKMAKDTFSAKFTIYEFKSRLELNIFVLDSPLVFTFDKTTDLPIRLTCGTNGIVSIHDDKTIHSVHVEYCKAITEALTTINSILKHTLQLKDVRVNNNVKVEKTEESDELSHIIDITESQAKTVCKHLNFGIGEFIKLGSIVGENMYNIISFSENELSILRGILKENDSNITYDYADPDYAIKFEFRKEMCDIDVIVLEDTWDFRYTNKDTDTTFAFTFSEDTDLRSIAMPRYTKVCIRDNITEKVIEIFEANVLNHAFYIVNETLSKIVDKFKFGNLK